MKIAVFWFKFHWFLFPMAQIINHNSTGLDNDKTSKEMIKYVWITILLSNIFWLKFVSYPRDIHTRARLGRVAPLGRPRSVYMSDIECRFVSRNGQMALKVKVNAFHFQYHLRESQDAYLMLIWWFELKSMKSYRAGKPKFKFVEYWVKMAKMTLKVKVNDPHFQYQLKVPKMHVWCKIGDSSPNLWQVIAWTSPIS